MVYGLRNKFRVHILGKEPVYSKKDLDKIANKHMRILPCVPIQTYSWFAVYNAYKKAGLSPEKAEKETKERIKL